MTCQGSHQTFIFGKHLRQCLLTRKMFLDSEITKNNPHVAKRHVFKEKERVPIKRLSARSKPWIRQRASTAWSCILYPASQWVLLYFLCLSCPLVAAVKMKISLFCLLYLYPPIISYNCSFLYSHPYPASPTEILS